MANAECEGAGLYQSSRQLNELSRGSSTLSANAFHAFRGQQANVELANALSRRTRLPPIDSLPSTTGREESPLAYMPDLCQPPFNTTLMGVVQGALNHFRAGVDPEQAFVWSGHAFLLNIHRTLCPSGPYCWNHDPFFERLRFLGLEVTVLGSVDHEDVSAKKRMESTLLEAMSRGSVCSVLSMEHQLVLGVEEKRLHLARPWGENDVTPPWLTRGNWKEARQAPCLMFLEFTPCRPERVGFCEWGMLFGIAAWNDENHLRKDSAYAVGAQGFRYWHEALCSERCEDLGSWWNAMVWSECRSMASRYFGALERDHDHQTMPSRVCDYERLAEAYGKSASLLAEAGDRQRSMSDRARSVMKAHAVEEVCFQELRSAVERNDLNWPVRHPQRPRAPLDLMPNETS